MLKMEVMKKLYLEDELEDLDDKELLELKNAVLDGEILYRFLYDGKKHGYELLHKYNMDLTKYNKKYIIPDDYYDIIYLPVNVEELSTLDAEYKRGKIKYYKHTLVPYISRQVEVVYEDVTYICNYELKINSIEDMKCKVSIVTKEDPYNILRRCEHNIGDPRPNGYYLVINYEAIVRCLVFQYRGDMIDIRYDYLVSYDRIYWFMYLIERTTDEDIHPSKFRPDNTILKIGNKPVIRYDIVIREPEEDTSNV